MNQQLCTLVVEIKLPSLEKPLRFASSALHGSLGPDEKKTMRLTCFECLPLASVASDCTGVTLEYICPKTIWKALLGDIGPIHPCKSPDFQNYINPAWRVVANHTIYPGYWRLAIVSLRTHSAEGARLPPTKVPQSNMRGVSASHAAQ